MKNQQKLHSASKIDLKSQFATFEGIATKDDNAINCLGRRVTSYTTRDAKEIAKLLAMVPFRIAQPLA
jgi:hypothetical protein